MASSVSMRAAAGPSAAGVRPTRPMLVARPAPRSGVVVRAEPPVNMPPPPPPPAGVSMPAEKPQEEIARFGFVDWAEKMNSRAAMIGFFSLLAVEGITGKPFLSLIGWEIGNGIDIGF